MNKTDNLIYLKYRLNFFTGSKLRFEKKRFPKFKAILLKGFKIYNNSQSYIEYSVDKQLIRSLKLSNVSGLIRSKSHEYYLLKMMENSIEYDPNENNMNFSFSSYDRRGVYYVQYEISSLSKDTKPNYDSNELREQRKQYQYRAKQHNAK
jgi:hypothetical protein